MKRKPPTPTTPSLMRYASLLERNSASSTAPRRGGLRRGGYWPQTLDPVVQTNGTTTPVKQVV